MEFTREQFIAWGLKRGELLARLECGCVIIQDRTADAYIVYCPKHKAAPELYEVCEQLADWDAGKFGKESMIKIIEISKRATQLIAKVRSK